MLLDAGGLGIALRHDQAPQRRPVLARHVLPNRQTFFSAKGNAPVSLRFGKKNTPAIVLHFDMAEMRPAILIHRDRGAQIDIRSSRIRRPHFAPPT